MKYSKDAIELSVMDAFKALSEIDESFDDALRNQYKGKLDEGISVSLSSPYNEEELKSKLEEEDDTTLKVIDINADTVEHLRDAKDYVGQLIAKCKVCQALRFMDTGDLNPSEEDPDVYNVDEECPHCHSEGKGYTLVGQVGQVPKAEEESTDVVVDDSGEDKEVSTEESEEVTLENDETPEEGKDLELEAEAETTETDTESSEDDNTEDSNGVNVYKEEPELKYDETTAEDDTEDLELPALGDEIDSDDVEEDDTEDKEKKEDEEVKESLDEARYPAGIPIKFNSNKKFKQSHNVWDFKTWDALQNHITDAPWLQKIEIIDKTQSTLNDCDVILVIYKNADGTYDVENETEYAEILNELHHISPDEVLRIARDAYFGVDETNENYIKVENKATVCESVDDLLNNIINCEGIEEVSCLGGEDGEECVYKGRYDELPTNLRKAKMKGFNVCGNTFIINIDTNDHDCDLCLKDLLDKFTDNACENISLVDSDNSEVFCGSRGDAIKDFGDCAVWCIDKPRAIQFITDCDQATPWNEDEETEGEYDSLINDIIKANGLNQAKVKNNKCVEYWIADSINKKEDLDVIYENYVLPNGEDLSNEFKDKTGYIDSVQEALINKLNESNLKADIAKVKAEAEKIAREGNYYGVVYGYKRGDDFIRLPDFYKCETKRELDLATQLVHNKNGVAGVVYVAYPGDGVIRESEEVENDPNIEEVEEVEEVNESFNIQPMKDEIYEWAKHDIDNNSILIETPEDKELFERLCDEAGFEGYNKEEHLDELFEFYLNAIHNLDEGFHKDLNEEAQLKASSEALNAGADKLDKVLTEKGFDIVVVTDDAFPGVIGIMTQDEEIRDKIKPEVEKIFKELYWKPNKVEDINDTDQIGVQYSEILLEKPIGIKESCNVKYFKTRKELSEELKELKNNNSPYSVRKSLKEGYRYEVVLKEEGPDPTFNPDDYKADDLDAHQAEYENEQRALEDEFDTNQFDNDINDYFDETIEDTVVYETLKGSKDKQGRIVLEGVLNTDKNTTEIKFLLEPQVNEDFGKTTYLVSNNLSEERFEFSFDNNVYKRVRDYLKDHPYTEDTMNREEIKQEICTNLFDKDYKDCDPETAFAIHTAVEDYFE